MRARTLIAWISHALFFLFVYASISKLIAFDYYLFDLKRLPMLNAYAKPVAILVPMVQLVVAVLLLSEKTRHYGLLGAMILMMMFTLYVVYVLVFTTERPCTCGGIIRSLSWPQHLVFDIAFLFISIIGFWLTHRLK